MVTVFWDVTPCILIDKVFGYHVSEVRNSCIDRRENLKTFTCSFFRRIHKIAKSDYYHRRVCLSVRPFGTARLPTDRFS